LVEEVMPVVLVIIIVAAWAVILGPNLLKHRARSGGDQSITHFHSQLRVLEQRAPDPIVTPAYRLRSVDGTGSPTAIHCSETGQPPVLTVVGAKELPRPALAFLGEPEVTAPIAEVPTDHPVLGHVDHPRELGQPIHRDSYGSSLAIEPTARSIDSFTRAQARRRRRDTLAVLVATFVVTALAGLVTSSTAAWAMAGLAAVALSAYVAVLVHLRRQAEERDAKLHYMDLSAGHLARAGGLPTHVSGRYAHPSNQHAVAR
jgi:hypothetical protein